MITEAQYNRLSQAQWKGQRVRSLAPIGTRIGVLPAGTMFTITHKFGGFDVTSDPCECCGFQMHISRVQPGKLERVE